MTPQEQKKAAKAFVERWKIAEGNEQRESNKFWIELIGEVLGIANPTHILDFERKAKGKRIDVFYEDMGILIENKSRGVDLDVPEQRGKDKYGNPRMVTPYEQAKWYADNITPRSVAPKWIVTCNFDTIRIYDLDNEKAETEFETINLEELPDLIHRFSFFTRKENSRAEREKQLSIRAGEVVGKLYDALSKSYKMLETSELEQMSLNIVVTRIVFLLYAEDADLLQEHQAFYKYLKGYKTEHMADALRTLFKVLNTPENERDPYTSPDALGFPYINGGLFKEEIVVDNVSKGKVIVPQFTDDMRFILLQEASAEFDWSGISPTIFGAVFESTLNPETRRAGGMHYTSIENIHKVTGPLFYDALKDELTAIEGLSKKKERDFKLRAFRQKIASLVFFDPANGSGNFLTETYLSLRKLENRVLEDLYGGEQAMLFEADPIMVSINQFYGMEINDFAVEVAKTALWIAELQMIDETREIMNMWIEPLPLKSNNNIVCRNALRTPWNYLLPPEKCNYIIGNPPFVGYKLQNAKQKEDMRAVIPSAKNLDYVCAWYVKAAEYIQGTSIRCALVSTNSIAQGEHVLFLWPILNKLGVTIDFAWKTFVWNSEATDQAHVHCVIIGFSSNGGSQKKRLFGDGVRIVDSINPYLVSGEMVILDKRARPICNVTRMVNGSEPRDGGFLTLDKEERDKYIDTYPFLKPYIKELVSSKDFLSGECRYCFWLKDASESLMEQCPPLMKRLDDCRIYRENSKQKQAHEGAKTPHLFASERQPDGNYLLIPVVSSARRVYIPIGYVGPEVITTNANMMIPDATLYEFGIVTSLFHNAWVRVVCGRLKSDYRYSNTMVYNNFVWPEPTNEQRQTIETCAQAVLDARENYPDKSLADLYDPDKMPSDLLAAHKALDAAVEAAYGVDFDGDEEKIVAHLFKLYAEKVKG